MLLRDVPLLVGSSWIEFCFSFQLRFMFHNLELIEQNVMLGKALLGISTFFHGGFFLFFLGPKGGTLQLHPLERHLDPRMVSETHVFSHVLLNGAVKV